jgi:hypothetical protein
MSRSAATAVENNPPALACYAAAEDFAGTVDHPMGWLIWWCSRPVYPFAKKTETGRGMSLPSSDTSQTAYAHLVCSRGAGRGGLYMLCALPVPRCMQRRINLATHV